MKPDDQVALAAVAGAHGVGGEVRLKLFAQSLDSLKRHETVTVGERSLKLASLRPGSAGAIARFAGIGDRNQAEALRGSLVTVPRSALPPLEEGEYYHSDLIGLPCVDSDGKVLGRVAAVENFGAGDILEIEREDGRKVMAPFRAGIADLEPERIVVDPEFLA